jgi:hypothetical protein
VIEVGIFKKFIRSNRTLGLPFKIRTSLDRLARNQDDLLMLMGNERCRAIRSENKLRRISDIGFKVHSQWEEDGIIEWLLQRIPVQSTTFVEFGVEDYTESNTRFLMKNRNWRGLIIDGGQANINAVFKQDIYWKHDLKAICSFITKDNINNLISEANFDSEVGLLSIDIDGNDYWVWDAIEVIKPRIIICEYNAVFGDIHQITVPYDKDFQRTRTHHSNLYFGASIKALEHLAGRKGYVIIGSNSVGTNAFFVRSDLYELVAGAIEDTCPLPSLIRESRNTSGKLTFVNGLRRFDEIKNLPVYRIDTREVVLLGSIEPVYSDEWLSLMRGIVRPPALP